MCFVAVVEIFYKEDRIQIVPSKTLNYFDLGTSLKGTCWGPEIVVKLSIST